MTQLLDYADAAKLLKKSPAALRQDVMKGRIRHIKLNRLVRFRIEDIENYISSNVVEATH